MKAFSISFFRLILCSVLLLFAAVCSVITVTAQTTEKKASSEEELKRQQELERKTLVLLDEIVSAGSTLKLPENRTFVLVSSGSLMWRHDQKRARNIFWEAINALNVMKGVKASGSEKSKNQAYFETFGWRREILQVVADDDANFALELLQASRQTPPESANAELFVNTERDLEQQIAANAAENDPKRALQLAREGLSKGLSLELINLLSRINDKDTELGSKFAGEVVDKLRAGAMTTEVNAPFIAIQLLLASRTTARIPSIRSADASTTFPDLVEARKGEKDFEKESSLEARTRALAAQQPRDGPAGRRRSKRSIPTSSSWWATTSTNGSTRTCSRPSPSIAASKVINTAIDPGKAEDQEPRHTALAMSAQPSAAGPGLPGAGRTLPMRMIERAIADEFDVAISAKQRANERGPIGVGHAVGFVYRRIVQGPSGAGAADPAQHLFPAQPSHGEALLRVRPVSIGRAIAGLERSECEQAGGDLRLGRHQPFRRRRGFRPAHADRDEEPRHQDHLRRAGEHVPVRHLGDQELDHGGGHPVGDRPADESDRLCSVLPLRGRDRLRDGLRDLGIGSLSKAPSWPAGTALPA